MFRWVPSNLARAWTTSSCLSPSWAWLFSIQRHIISFCIILDTDPFTCWNLSNVTDSIYTCSIRSRFTIWSIQFIANRLLSLSLALSIPLRWSQRLLKIQWSQQVHQERRMLCTCIDEYFLWEWWWVIWCPKKIHTLYKMQSRYDAVKRAVTNNLMKENQTLLYNFFELLTPWWPWLKGKQ